MSDQAFQRELGSDALAHVQPGTSVYDRSGGRIGTVEHVYLGAASEEADAHGTGAATADAPALRDSTPVEDFIRAVLPDDDLPDGLRERLLRQGFIRIDAVGLFAADRYVLPGQIETITPDRVVLRVARDDLIRD